jgi:hypothetical protein
MGNWSYWVFTGVFVYLTNWFQINTFVISLLHPRKSIKTIKDDWIISTVKQKTGLTLKRIIVFKNQQLFGMMPGIPLRPELILSSALYKKLDRDEMEWVILHEAGHCVLWHVVKSGVVELTFLVLGLWLVSQKPIFSFIMGVILSLLCIQVLRLFEYEADKYSIDRVANPQGVITAQEKFRQSRNPDREWLYSEQSIFRNLLFWNIMPSQRIAIAKERLKG